MLTITGHSLVAPVVFIFVPITDELTPRIIVALVLAALESFRRVCSVEVVIAVFVRRTRDKDVGLVMQNLLARLVNLCLADRSARECIARTAAPAKTVHFQVETSRRHGTARTWCHRFAAAHLNLLGCSGCQRFCDCGSDCGCCHLSRSRRGWQSCCLS